MKNTRAIRAIALAMCATLLFAGCGGSGKKASSDNSASTAATETKDELHIAVSANPPSLDVQTSNSSLVGEIAAHVFEPLFAMDDKYEPTPVLADSYEVNDEQMGRVKHIRQISQPPSSGSIVTADEEKCNASEAAPDDSLQKDQHRASRQALGLEISIIKIQDQDKKHAQWAVVGV